MPKNSKSSKPTSQNVAFPNLPTLETCQKQPKAQNLHPKTLPVQIFQHSKQANSKSSKPTSQNLTVPYQSFQHSQSAKNSQKLKTYILKRCLSKSSNIRNMPKTAKSSKPTSQNVACPNLPTFKTGKQQELNTYIPKPYCTLPKLPTFAKCQKQPKAQNLYPKTLPFQIFQHSKQAVKSKSSKPTSQNVAFPNLPTFESAKNSQKLKTYILKRCLSKSSNIRKVPETVKAQNLHPKTVPFQIFQHSQMPKTAKAQSLHPKTLPFQIFQHSKQAKNSKSSKPTSRNVAFPNLPTFETCQKQQSSKPTSQNVAFPDLPTFEICQKQQKLKTYIPKRCLSKSSNIGNMQKRAKA